MPEEVEVDWTPQSPDPVRDALMLIDKYGCTNFIGERCSDPGSGRVRGARYGADAWCDACIARDALEKS